MNTYTIAYRDSKGAYEVHSEHCRHLTTGKVEPMFTTGNFSTAKEVAADFDRQDGMFGTTVSPCAK